MKFPYLFKPTETAAATTTTSAPAWPWPACVNSPKTLSFRADTTGNIYKAMNSAYLEGKCNSTDFTESDPDSFFSIRETFEHHSEDACSNPEQPIYDESTAVIGGLRSERLFFRPGETSSILEEAKAYDFPYKENVEIMAVDSRDPFRDFTVSMEEMVEAHGLKDWESLEELLMCYLRVNEKSNHGYIVGAFVDLLLRSAFASSPVSASASASNECSSSSISATNDEHCSSSSTTTHYSFTSPLSFSSSTYSSVSPCLSLLENEDEIVVEKTV